MKSKPNQRHTNEFKAQAVGERFEAQDLRALQRENALLKQENDILKKAAIILYTKPPIQLREMIEHIHHVTSHENEFKHDTATIHRTRRP